MLVHHIAALAVVLAAATPAFAQTAGDHVAQGDAERAALRPAQALAHYEAALGEDSTAQVAFVNAAIIAVTVAEYQADGPPRDSLFARAARYARRAVALNPNDAHAHFALARALGRFAVTLGIRERARMATEIRDEALAALAIKPDHAGALHVLGLWHQNVMKLSGIQRLIARTLLGAKAMGEASWEQAESSLEAAVRAEPAVIVHRLNLGRLYVEREQWEKAREQLQWVLNAPSVDYNDGHYKREAEKALKRIP